MLFEHKTNLYTKDNLIISIAGKIQDIQGLKNLLVETFGSLPANKKLDKPEFKQILPAENK
jgi:predicted Zn-dependent peptidase